MPKVRETVRPHRKTVSEHKQHAKKRTVVRRKDAQPVRNIKVNDEVWEVAWRLSGGELKRLVVKSETCVIILNPTPKD